MEKEKGEPEKTEDKGPIHLMKKFLTSHRSSDKKPNKYQYFLAVVLLGVGIMIAGNMFLSSPEAIPTLGTAENDKQEEVETFGQSKVTGNEIIDAYENQYETQLKEVLEGIQGVGDVDVAVNVDATEKKILEKNVVVQSQKTTEKDREGGERTVDDQSKDEQLVIIRDGEKEVPIVVETKKPAIRGVIVTAKGADNIEVKKWILESVTKLLDVPIHRVSVMPKK